MYKSEFLQIVSERGFIKQCTNAEALDVELASKSCTGYVGFDCTACSLHVGSLLQIMMMRWFQKCGHRPIILCGGATTRIGDPSDKTEMRKMLSDAQISANKASLSKVFEKFIDFSNVGDVCAVLVDNWDWLKDVGYLDFLRACGTHFTINRMLTFDSVKLRLDREQPLTFLEFNYMLLQAYDFVELSRRYGCVLEFGGSEQWGNIVNGVEFGRRVLGKELYGITTDTILTSAGHKMGKTAQGAIWLNEELLSSHGYWQFWRNTDDKDVVRFLKLYTELSLDEIARYEVLEGQELNEAKVLLANEATAMCHGSVAATEATRAAKMLFSGCEVDESLLPTVNVARDEVVAGTVNVYTLLMRAKLCKSGREARDAICGGGLKVNGVAILDPLHPIKEGDFGDCERLKLVLGKKKCCAVVIV